MNKQLKGSIALLTCTVIWGFAFIAQSVGMDLIGPFTFRAAAAEQLTIWGERAHCDVIRHNEGADPAAVVFDAVKAAIVSSLILYLMF